MNSVVLGEWATPGNLDGWSGTDMSGLSSTGGYITGTGTASNPSIQKTGIAGPDLDFGFFDYLQIRIKAPASFNDDIVFSFGTTVNGGFASNREFLIPDANIPKDGDWHTYRLDLGLVVWWRDTLTDIKVFPLGNSGSGQTFYIDYVEVGDLPDDVLLVNTDININTSVGETFSDCSYMESKHAVFWYSPESYVRFTGFDPQVHGRRALRMIEECYQVYCKKLNYVEPFESFELWRRDGNRYKVNHVTWFSGFWCGGYNGFMHVGINGWGLGDEGWGNPMPHEFGHAIQGHQPGFLTGGHWESHANFLRDSRTEHYGPLFTSHPSELDYRPVEMSNVRQDHSRLIYADFRIHAALKAHAADMGLSPTLVGDFWTETPKEMTVYDKLAQMLPAGYNVKDVVASCMRHWPLLDMNNPSYNAQLWDNINDKAWWFYITGSYLVPCADKPGWWRVPLARAPEKYASMSHALAPTGSTVTVEFRGMDVQQTGEDWRWSLVAVDDAGNARYSDLWQPGTYSMALNPSESKVYLLVTATPDSTALNLIALDNVAPIDRHPDRLRYPYEVRITGAAPVGVPFACMTGTGHAHSNGGGWVDNTASVDSTAYIGPNAMVLGTAKVYNDARIEDYAVVMENATVRDNAVVSGYAVVRGNSVVSGNARIRDRAVVYWGAQVSGYAKLEEFAHPFDSPVFTDNAVVRGVAMPFGSGVLSGTAIASHDYSMWFNLSDGALFSHVPWGEYYNDYYHSTCAKPRGLTASYRFDRDDTGEVCWDEFGDKHAFFRGSPSFRSDSDMNSRVLSLNGTDQYLVFDRDLCDSYAGGSYAMWVKPAALTPGMPLLFMGSAADKRIELTIADMAGHIQLTVQNTAAQTVQIVSAATVSPTSWTHVCVVLNGSTANLYMNGTLSAQASTAVRPENVLAANDYSQAEAMYIGRNWTGSLLAGDIEDVRFYNVALTADEIANEIQRCGDIIGVFYYNSPQDFDGSTTEAQSGVHNGLERVLEASIYPDTSDDVGYYEGILDCTDERDGSFEGTGFGLDNGEILIRLENVGFWRTGIYVTLGQWQKITVGFNGRFAELYVNDVLQASRTYSATENDVAGKNYRIGFAMDTASSKYYFDGRIKDIFVSDRFNLGDNQSPAPDPAEWASAPEALSGTEITMTAAAGTDASGIVEYYFDETSGNPGGNDSGWQTDPIYNDTGLESGYEYTYTVKMRDKYNNETETSVEGKAKTPCPADFNTDATVDADDLQTLLNDWLTEYVLADPGLVGRWTFDEQSGTTVYDAIGGNHGTIYGGATLNGSGYLTFDGSNDYVELPIGELISTLTNSTFAVWVDFSNSGGAWQRIFDFGSGTAINMFLTPRTGTDGPMRFAIKALGGGEQQVTAPSTLASGMHHVAVTIDADNDTIVLYLDGSPIATNTSATYTPADMGVTTQNWLGKSQYADAYLSASMDEFNIFNYALSVAEIEHLAGGIAPVEPRRKTDLNFDGIINLQDFADFSPYWLE